MSTETNGHSDQKRNDEELFGTTIIRSFCPKEADSRTTRVRRFSLSKLYAGETVEIGHGERSARYRIGPLTVKQFGVLRFFLDRESIKCYVDAINRIVYVDDVIHSHDSNELNRLGFTILERQWSSSPPRFSLSHFLNSVVAGYQTYRHTLKHPPREPFIDELKVTYRN